jgi:sensor c-di-GMP phosphodiesterase-like protein
MQRSKVIGIGIFMAVMGSVLPIALMAYLSWQTALEHEQFRLKTFAERVVERADLSFLQATNALQSFTALQVAPCSSEHIEMMRRATVNTRSVEEVSYFENGLQKCNSWGLVTQEVQQNKVDFTAPSGVQVTLKMHPLIRGADAMMALHLGSHTALINMGRFVDVIVEPGVFLALAKDDGVLVAVSDGASSATVQSFLARQDKDFTSTSLHAQVKKGGWIGIAGTSEDSLLTDLRHEQLWMLPIGVLIALAMIGLVVLLSRRRLSPLAELALAVKRREFVVHYQPLIELKTRRCVGAEALVRWQRPDGTMVRPDLFIPLAEESGLIKPITDQVIEAVVRDLGEVLVQDRSLHIAINLCADDIKTGRFQPIVTDALQKSGIHAEQIWLEATERGFMDLASARATLTRARALGHSVAIDDFGTGYSSLQYLQDLPMDTLKIDRSFVSTIGTDAVSSPVISHIIAMAKSLNFFIVAEGVETQAQADFLAARGVHFAQGWLFAKALPVNEFMAFYLKTKNTVGAGPKVIQTARTAVEPGAPHSR